MSWQISAKILVIIIFKMYWWPLHRSCAQVKLAAGIFCDRTHFYKKYTNISGLRNLGKIGWLQSYQKPVSPKLITIKNAKYLNFENGGNIGGCEIIFRFGWCFSGICRTRINFGFNGIFCVSIGVLSINFDLIPVLDLQ